MKKPVQLDAHVQSHHEYLREKEKERIKEMLLYFREKRSQFTLKEHPVGPIHFSIKKIQPILHVPMPQKLPSYESNVKLERENVNIEIGYETKKISTDIEDFQLPSIENIGESKFEIDNFYFANPYFDLNSAPQVNIIQTSFSYQLDAPEIDLDSIQTINPTQVQITAHSWIPNVNIQPSSFSTVDLHSISQVNIIQTSFSYQLDTSKITLDNVPIINPTQFQITTPSWIPNVNIHTSSEKFIVPALEAGTLISPVNIHHTNISYNSNILIVNLSDVGVPIIPKYSTVKLNCDVNVGLKDLSVIIPNMSVKYMNHHLNVSRTEIPQPNLDFTDTLLKFKIALSQS